MPGPALPYQNDETRRAGRSYLGEVHKIPSSVIRRAEQAKFLHYGRNGIAFLGLDADRSWAISAWLHPCSDGPSRVIQNSDLSVPPMLPGDPQQVVLCSDGVSALRALAEAERNGRSPPTVIALYGSRPENLLLTLPQELRDLVVNAERVTGFGLVTTRAVFDQVEQIRLLHGHDHWPERHDLEHDTNLRGSPDPTGKPTGGGT